MTTWLGTADTLVAGDTSALVTKFNNTARDAVKALSEAWTAYTPVWTAATTNPAPGNGSLSGSYALINKTCFYRWRITMGSTTTYGTGVWLVTLPAIPHANYVANSCVSSGAALDLSAGWPKPLTICRYVVGDARVFAADTAALVGATGPFVWADGDILSSAGSFETA